MQTANHSVPSTIVEDEALLEEIRLLILGGLFFLDAIDPDDLPIADRIGMVQDHLYRDPHARTSESA